MNRFIAGLVRAAKITETVGKDSVIIGAAIAPVLPMVPAPAATTLAKLASMIQTHKLPISQIPLGENTMNPQLNMLEQLGITIILSALQTTIKNPSHAAILRSQLVGVATDIFQAYGLNPPSDTPAPKTMSAAAGV